MAARAIPRKTLEQIRDEDPARIDEAMLAVAHNALEIRSDDAPAIVVSSKLGDGWAHRLLGDAEQCVEFLEQIVERANRAPQRESLAPTDSPGAQVQGLDSNGS